MLKIIVELHPYGNEKLKRKIAEMDLWNTGTGNRLYGNYEGSATIMPSEWDANPSKSGGVVLEHTRQEPVWNLIYKMLHAMGYGEYKL